MITKRHTLNMTSGDTIRVNIVGNNGIKCTIKHGGSTYYLQRPGTQTQDFTLTQKHFTVTFYEIGGTPGDQCGVVVNPSAPKDSHVTYTDETGTTIYNGRTKPNATPTYLETLDKLDQWSSAHYIPNSRNKLNHRIKRA